MTLRARGRRALLAGVSALALSLAAERVRADPFLPAWWLSVEGRLYGETGARQPWAVVAGFFNANPETSYTNVRNGAGLRFALGYRIAPPWSVAIAYTGLRGNRRRGDVASKPYRYLYPVIGAYRTTGFPFYPSTARVTIDNALDIVDFEVGFDVGLGDGATLRLFGGPRILLWSHRVDTQFNFDYIVSTSVLTERLRASFFGAGPRLGADGKWTLGRFGGGAIFVRGTVSASALFGVAETRVETEMNSPGAGRFRNEFVRSRSAVVYSTEGAVSLGYTLTGVLTGRLTLEAGYRVEAWWKLMDTRGAPYAAGCACLALSGVTGSRGGNVVQHGPFFRATIKF